MNRKILAIAMAAVGGFAISAARADSSYSDNYNTAGDTGDWTPYNSTVSNTGGSTVTITNNDSTTSGTYSSFGGNRIVFSSATESLDVYVDPTAAINGSYTYQWDLSAGLNQSDKSTFLQDFIFHADGNGSDVDIWSSNNSSDGPVTGSGPSIGSPDYAISSAGWYTFKWNFQNDGSGGLDATLSLYNQGSSSALQTWNYNTGNDPLLAAYDFSKGAENRYLWFTYLTPSTLDIDNESFNGSAVPLPASAWSGLALFGGLAAFGGFKRLRQQTA